MRLLITLAVLAALLVGADRLAANAAEKAVADRLQTAYSLDREPSVQIDGFPFITQAVSGTYQDLQVTAQDISGSGVAVDRVVVRLRDVHVPFSAVVKREVSQVHAEQGTGSVLVGYDALSARLGSRHLRVSPGQNGQVKVTGTLSVLGQAVSASTQGRLSVRGRTLLLSCGPEAADVAGHKVTLGAQFDARVPLPTLPFGVKLASVTATAEGVVISASADNLVVGNRTSTALRWSLT